MNSRGGGAGWLWFILMLVVIGVVAEIIKMLVALVGIAFLSAIVFAVLALAIVGLGRFFDDVHNRRAVAVKCIIPFCIIGVALLLCGPKMLGLFQNETGILWWHKTETNYLKLTLFVMFTTPIVFGFGYAFSDMLNHNKTRHPIRSQTSMLP